MIQSEKSVSKTKTGSCFIVLTSENMSDVEMVSLLNQYEKSIQWNCDGSLIRDSLILDIDNSTLIDGVMTYKWKYYHLMEESPNPIEICMK